MFEDLYEISEEDVLLRVHVQPGAGRTSVVGRHGDALKVKVGAPPDGGRANDALIALLAEALGVAPSTVTVDSGASSRNKRVRIAGAGKADVAKLLELAAERGTGNAGGGRGVSRHAP